MIVLSFFSKFLLVSILYLQGKDGKTKHNNVSTFIPSPKSFLYAILPKVFSKIFFYIH